MAQLELRDDKISDEKYLDTVSLRNIASYI
jgi:hypothetical protein